MIYTSHYRKKDGAWQLIISYKDSDGRWKQKSKQGFETRSAAKQFEVELLDEIKKQPRPVDQSMAGISLLDFCKVYVKTKQSIAKNTKQQYIQAVKSLGALADRPIHTIRFLDLQTAVSEWKINPNTQRQYLGHISIVFRAAVRPYGLISANPCQDIEIAKNRDKTERQVLSEEQFRILINTRRADVAMAAAIGYYAGLRAGEIFGLTWKDVNWRKMTITVDRQLDVRARGYKTAKPKTKNSFRTIPIPQPLLQMLHKYHETTPLELHRRLFPRPHSTYDILTKSMKKISADFSAHSLRHTYATNLLAKGIDIRTVAALMGDDVKTVLNTYVHYSDAMREAAARDIQKIFAQNF